MSDRSPQVNLTRPDQTKPGLGVAELTVVNFDGKSVVAHQYSQAPLQLHRPLYLDDQPYPTVFMKTPCAGLLAGDRHYLKLFAAQRSTIKMLNQSATLVYPGPSELEIEIRIEKGATVYFEPCPLILARGASFKQTIRVDMSAQSRLRYIDEWSAGRIAMDECFLFERFDNTIEIRVDGDLKYRERFVLAPTEEAPHHPLIAGNFTRFKSTYDFGNWQAEESPSAPPAVLCQSAEAAPPVAADLLIEPISSLAAESLTWRMQRPWGTVERSLSAPFAQAEIDRV